MFFSFKAMNYQHSISFLETLKHLSGTENLPNNFYAFIYMHSARIFCIKQLTSKLILRSDDMIYVSVCVCVNEKVHVCFSACIYELLSYFFLIQHCHVPLGACLPTLRQSWRQVNTKELR